MIIKKRIILMLANTSWYLWNFRASTIRALLDSGCRVICIAPQDDSSSRLTGLGAEYLNISMDGASTDLLREFQLLAQLFRIIRMRRPDIVFNFTIKMNTYAGICSHFLGIPYVNNISGLGTAFIHKSPALMLARKLYGYSNIRSKRVFFQNEEDQNQFIDQKLVEPGKAVLLPGSGINTYEFSREPFPVGPITFLMVARLIADKGVREYIAAAKIVKSTYPHIRFILVGPNAVQNHSAISNDEIAAWKKERIVELPGATEDVRPWLKESHVLVLPSYREGMPRTVLEAAAVGRPAIVTDVPGCRQSIVPDYTGWLCEVRNSDSLAAKMLHVIENPNLISEFGNRAAERVRLEFSDKIVVKEYLKCLEFITNKETV